MQCDCHGRRLFQQASRCSNLTALPTALGQVSARPGAARLLQEGASHRNQPALRPACRRRRTARDAGTSAAGRTTPEQGVRYDGTRCERSETSEGVLLVGRALGWGGFTHVIQARACWPKASCHAGSRDWKNSSGWKKVRSVKALTMRKASSRAKRPSVASRWVVEDRVGGAGPVSGLSLAGIEQSSGGAMEHDGEDWEWGGHWRGRAESAGRPGTSRGGPCGGAGQGATAGDEFGPAVRALWPGTAREMKS